MDHRDVKLGLGQADGRSRAPGDDANLDHGRSFKLRHDRPEGALVGYMGGLTPSFSAVTDALVRLPSGCLKANTKTAAPGFRRLASPGA